MKRYSERRIRLVVRATRLEDLIVRYNTIGQARFVIEKGGGSFDDIFNEHALYVHTKSAALSILDALGRVEVLDRRFVANYVFGQDDLVICLGQDGLVANVLKYLPTQPVLGINPDPERWDGVLLKAQINTLEKIVKLAVDTKLEVKQVCLAEVKLNDGQVLRGVNDLFIGAANHSSARYSISTQEMSERHSSSGVIVSTGLGSTGWYSSLIGGAYRLVQHEAGLAELNDLSWEYSRPELRFTVREPFLSKTTGNNLICGVIFDGGSLVIESHMGESGIIFSDGMQDDYLAFNAGVIAKIGVSEQSGWLLEPVS
jgi:hypothetical protein